ncbi:hypothetical protein L1987_12012 [Smallanthus sonchifolius]|uniref:Uncharacterized protein n=1 Tax=Smallanthus sonchifolius TaxID=185202 RepID=A0ACB9JDF0_9ASTR|nr:hypothetical protein L1987_12012 [Smallanthus sonchifolius]
MAFAVAESRLISNIIVPDLDKIIKNSSWRKRSKLAHEAKSVLEPITSTEKPPTSDENQSDVDTSPQSLVVGVLHDSGTNELTLAESELILSPFINDCSLGNVKIAEPALDCIQKLIAHGYLHGEADPTGGPDAKLLAKLIESVCKCHDFGEEGVELLVLKKKKKMMMMLDCC